MAKLELSCCWTWCSGRLSSFTGGETDVEKPFVIRSRGIYYMKFRDGSGWSWVMDVNEATVLNSFAEALGAFWRNRNTVYGALLDATVLEMAGVQRDRYALTGKTF